MGVILAPFLVLKAPPDQTPIHALIIWLLSNKGPFPQPTPQPAPPIDVEERSQTIHVAPAPTYSISADIAIQQPGYVYISTPLSYGAATVYCTQQYGSTLATIMNDTDKMNANNKIDNSFMQQTWIGLFSIVDEGFWLFQDGQTCSNEYSGACVDFWGTLNLGINAPKCINPKEGGHRCAYYKKSTGLVYNDLDCLQKRSFLCQINLPQSQPPHEDLNFYGVCPCQDVIYSECNANDNTVTMTCREPDYLFDSGNDAIRSCIDIDETIIPLNSGIFVQDVIISTKLQHFWVGNLQSYIQKGQKQVKLFGDDRTEGCCGCDADNVDVTLSDDALLSPSYSRICDGVYNGFGIGGIRKPIESLSIFDGDIPNGRWSFYIYDYDVGTPGIFGTWSLKLKLSQCPNLGNSAKTINSNIEGNNNSQHNAHNVYQMMVLNVISSASITMLIISIVYCLCFRKKTSGRYKYIDEQDGNEHDSACQHV